MNINIMKIRNALIVSLILLVLASCGSSDNDTAEEPPAPDMTADGGSGDSGGGSSDEPAVEPMEEPLVLSCSENPATNNIGVGATARAVFSFNRATNANGDIRSSCGAILLDTDSVSVMTTRNFDQNVPLLCSGETLKVELTTATLSASCTWEVN